MATVPFDSLARVEQRGSRPVFQNSNVPSGAFDFGGESLIRAGQGVGVLGDELGQLALQMQQEDNENEAKAADNRISSRIRRILYGGQAEDGSVTPGFMQSQRQTTLDTFGSAEETIRQTVEEEIQAADGNNQLQQMIRQAASGRVDSALDRMTNHASEQRLAHQDGISMARRAEALADAVADPYSPEVIKQSLGRVAAEVLDHAERHGIDEPEEIDMLMRAEQSLVVEGVFQQYMIAEDIETAQAFFHAHHDKLTPAMRTDMAQSLAKNMRLVTAQNVAREVFSDARFRDDRVAGIEEIDRRLDGAEQSAAMELFRSLITDSRADTRWKQEEINARETEAARSRPAQMQQLVDSILTDMPEAAEGEIRAEIKQRSGYGLDRSAALNMYDEYLRRERGDASENLGRQNLDAFQEANSLVEGWLEEGRSTDEIRDLIFNIEDPLIQKQANEFYGQQLRGERDDESYIRSMETEARVVLNHEYKLRDRERDKEIREARIAVYNHLFAEEGDASLRAFRAANRDQYNILAKAGLINNLVNTERAVAEGNVFATISDNETMGKLRLLNPNEQAQIEPVLYQSILTRQEFDSLTSIVARARETVRAGERSTNQINFGRSELKRLSADFIRTGPSATPKDQKMMATVVASLDQWIADQREAKGNVSQSDITTQAARFMLELRADVRRGGIGFQDILGVGDIGGNELVAGMAHKLTPEQRAVVTVDIDDLSQEAKNGMAAYISDLGWTHAEWTDDLIAQLAGAWAVGDDARINRLMQENGGRRAE